MRRILHVLAMLLAVPIIAFGDPGDRASVDIMSRKKVVMVPMRDGTRLHTELFLPNDTDAFPTILIRTTYAPTPFENQPMFDAGYAIVIQTQRGRGGSEGQEICFLNDSWGEVQDGYDIVEWIHKQSFCNGKIATMGVSGPGITQYMLAGAAPDDLTCQWIGLAGGNVYDIVFHGGAHRQALFGWLKASAYDQQYHKQLFKANRDYGDFWKQVNLNEPAAYKRVRTPILHFSGWYDCFSQGALDAFCNIHHHGAKGARGNQYLIMGPWIHGMTNKIGELTFPESCLHPPAATHAGPWMDHWLKGKANEVEKQPHVIYWTMGDITDNSGHWNKWRTAADWPPCETTPTPFYLHAGSKLSVDLPQSRNDSVAFTFDPTNPVPTLGGNNYMIKQRGPYDQRPVENRPDVLLFTTAPLARPLEVTGRLTARVHVYSSANDTDFTVKLTDVYPDGRSMLIADGIIRMRYRQSKTQQKFMTPGQIYQIDIDLWSTSYVFNTNHRIRIAVSSSNYPRFDANPNTGGPWLAKEDPIIAHNKVYVGNRNPSQITLPIAGDAPVFVDTAKQQSAQH